jgi:hypothetical protein
MMTKYPTADSRSTLGNAIRNAVRSFWNRHIAADEETLWPGISPLDRELEERALKLGEVGQK